MARLGILLPYADMLDMAETVVREENLDVAYMKAISSVEAVNEARAAIEAGAEVIVARGYQALLIKKYTKIPIVEIRLHAQEIGLLLKKAHSMAKKLRPRVAVIVFENMLADMSHMEELFDVEMRIAYMEQIEEGVRRLHEIAEEGIDIVIGGGIICEEAERMGYPAMLYRSSLESVREALSEAKRLADAMEAEKQGEAQFETVLDTSFGGIVKINSQGNITAINKPVENLIGKSPEDVIGLSVTEVFPDFDSSAIGKILKGERDSYSVSVNLRHEAWVLLMAPIRYNERITGAILSLQKISESIYRGSSLSRDMYLYGFVAQTTFRSIHTENEEMQNQIELAKKYALSQHPVLIYSEEGTEYYQFAEAIHNNSNRKSGPFVSVDVHGLDPERQMEAIFGRMNSQGDTESSSRAAMVRAQHGTIYIRGIEHLNLQVQHQITRMAISDGVARADVQAMDELDVRIIVSSKVNLLPLVERGEFSEKLYYILQGLTLEIPALNQREEDLVWYFRKFLREYCEKYNKRLVTTNGVEERLKKLAWRGNILQLRVFCERLVITADKRSVDEVLVQKIYDQLYPQMRNQNGLSRMLVYGSPEADRINELMDKYHGSRTAVAKELGISTTTLWRRMKKYGIEAKYNP